MRGLGGTQLAFETAQPNTASGVRATPLATSPSFAQKFCVKTACKAGVESCHPDLGSQDVFLRTGPHVDTTPIQNSATIFTLDHKSTTNRSKLTKIDQNRPKSIKNRSKIDQKSTPFLSHASFFVILSASGRVRRAGFVNFVPNN